MKIMNYELKKTKNGYRYSGSLNLRCFTGLTSLPENLSAGDSLDLEGCTGLTSLPENLSVGGSLYLFGCTGLTSLPENLSVGGSLGLEGCIGLTSLPENLSVGGSLGLRGCIGLIDCPVVHNCGNENRTIYIKKQNPKLIHIGCFVGTQKEAINAVKLKYGNDSNDYVAKIKKCFEIAELKWGGE